MISAADILSARILVVDPHAVLDLYREQDFDAILLDVRMPVMDGFVVSVAA